MPAFGQWKYTVDREATIAAYQLAESGVSTCDCVFCRNFRLARGHVFSAVFLDFLDSLGIEPSNAAEVYHNARLGRGRHDYGGWYHFVGSLEETDDFPPVDFGNGFIAWMCRASAPRLGPFGGLAVVQLEFHCDAVPWLLDEAEPA
jgi:hypothetical protein